MLQDQKKKKKKIDQPQHFFFFSCAKNRDQFMPLNCLEKGEGRVGVEKWLKYKVREGKHSSRHCPQQVQSCSIADSSGLTAFISSAGGSFWAVLSAVVSMASV